MNNFVINTAVFMMVAAAVTQQHQVPTSTPKIVLTPYYINAGDTFYSLAQKFKIGVSAMATANPKVSPTKLYVGEKVFVPQTK